MIISISPMAQVDLKEIKEYIESELENSEAAINTITKITKSIYRLSEVSDLGALLSSKASIQIDCRFLIAGSYFVFYRHEHEHIYVLRVLYGRRDYMKIIFADPHDNNGWKIMNYLIFRAILLKVTAMTMNGRLMPSFAILVAKNKLVPIST